MDNWINQNWKSFTPVRNYWRRHRQIPATLLIPSIENSGQPAWDQMWVRWFLCRNLWDHDQACDQCVSCRRSATQSSFDFRRLDPESASADEFLEEIRQLKEGMGFGSQESVFKVILIQNAEKLRVTASNALLKVLEEPPHGWIFILGTRHPQLLLPTLQSRCFTLRLRSVPSKEFDQEKTMTQEKSEVFQWFNQVLNEVWKKRIPLNQAELNKKAEWIAGDESRLGEALDAAEIFLWKFATHLSAPAPTPRSTQLFRAFDRCQEVRALMDRPLNRKILVQSWLNDLTGLGPTA